MTSRARKAAALERPGHAPFGPPAPSAAPAVSMTSIRNPYSVREAAALLGVSPDAIEANYEQLEGRRVGRRILIPRWAVDRLLYDPRDGGEEPALKRVLALLPLLARDERVQVAQAALAAAQEG